MLQYLKLYYRILWSPNLQIWLSVIWSRPNLKVWIPKNTKTYASVLKTLLSDIMESKPSDLAVDNLVTSKSKGLDSKKY